MSLILDALRKSERTRQQTLSGRVSTAGSALDRGRVPVPWATLISLLLVANVIVLGVVFWRGRAPAPLAPPPVPVVEKSEVTTRPAVYRPVVRSLAAEAAAVGGLATGGAIVSLAPSVVSRAAVTAPARSALASVVTGTAASVATAPTAVAGIAAPDSAVPTLDSLPLAFQQSLPPLHLDVHSYSGDPASRFVVINMQRYTRGETLAAGPTVVAIVVNGVILEYHGQKFLLPRP